MLKPISLYIGLRYTISRTKNGFISFISIISMVGIALGVAILITVLSVMNGFDYQIKQHIFKMADQVVVSSVDNKITQWRILSHKMLSLNKNIKAVAPFIDKEVMVSANSSAQGIMLRGVEPKLEKSVSVIDKMMVNGRLSNLKRDSFGIVIGDQLADMLGVDIGDPITVISQIATITPFGMMPRFKVFHVVGIFHIGGGFGFDSGIGFINLHDAQKLFELGSNVTSLRLRVSELYAAPIVSKDLVKKLPEKYMISNWTTRYKGYFRAISMEKTMMFVILLFIIAVATFNLVSGLVMNVREKRSDIAILRTLGMSPREIMFIFIIQGMLIGFIGTFLGVVSGIIMSINAPAIVNFIEQIFHTHFISSSVYFINYLPSRLNYKNVMYISFISIILSLLATIYPSLRAAKMNPAEELRYE